jgi:hypothetical protein
VRLYDLTDLMDSLARQTWFNLNTARRLEMRMGEVTVSEVNLLAMRQLLEAKGLPVELVATRADEATTGVDFEIWLTHKASRFFGYSIQAKIIDVRKGKFTYPKLGHRNTSGTFQYDLLEAHAISVGSHPVHVFYNGWAASAGEPSLPAGSPREHFGCAAVMTSIVRDVRAATTKPFGAGTRASVQASDYLPLSIPWSDLFRVPEVYTTVAPSNDSDDNNGGVEREPGDGDGPGDFQPVPHDPSWPPRRPIDLSPRDLNALERKVHKLGGEGFETRRPTKLPDYITQARGKSRSQLPRTPDLPLFALVVGLE